MKKNILVFADYFLPAQRAGGPVLTLHNLIETLKADYNFFVVTGDRDLGDVASFGGVTLNQWSKHRGIDVKYITPDERSVATLLAILKEQPWDLIYLNSFLSRFFSILVVLCNAVSGAHIPVLLAPKGEFSPGFLGQKPYRKRAFLALVRWLRMYEGVSWQASTEHEKRDILAQLPRLDGNVFVAEDLAVMPDEMTNVERIGKVPGELRVCFVSRIHRMKNLHWALDVLRETSLDLEFNIYGPIHDESYWRSLGPELEAMPSNVSVTYRGDVPHSQVYEVFSQHHLMFLPTLGENFGHVIIEALLSGCPVLMSDNTAWNSVNEHGCGWALDLGDKGRFLEALRTAHEMDAEQFAAMSHRAMSFGRYVLENDDVVEAHRRMFDASMGRGL